MCWKTYEDFYVFKGYPIKKAFQSFFKNVSDAKDLYDAVNYHFEIEKILNNLDKAHKKIQIEKNTGYIKINRFKNKKN